MAPDGAGRHGNRAACQNNVVASEIAPRSAGVVRPLSSPLRRRRGPRSNLALLRRRRRCVVDAAGLLRGDGSCGAEPLSPLDNVRLNILHVDIQGLRSHKAELEARLLLMPSRPHIVCVNETFLDQAVEFITLAGYTVACRLDRRGAGNVVAFSLAIITAPT